MHPNIHSVGDNPLHRNVSELLRNGRAREAQSAARALAQRGDCHGYALLGAVHEFGGHDFPRNPQTALGYYQQSIDMCGSVEGCLGVGRILYRGDGVARDLYESFRIYRLVADVDHHYVAQYMTALMYQRGEGVDQDLQLAEDYARQAIRNRSIFALRLMADIRRTQHRHLGHIFWSVKAYWVNKFRKRSYLDRRI